MRTGYHGRSRDIRVRPTSSGQGWRVFSTRTAHVGEVFPNGRGGITVRLDGKYVRTEKPPNCVDGAGRRLIGIVRRAVQADKAKEPRQPKGGLKICLLCRQPRVVDSTGVCRRCDERTLNDSLDHTMSDMRSRMIAEAGLDDYEPRLYEFFPDEPDDGGPADEDIDWAEREVVTQESLEQLDHELFADSI